ncbi:uncharacterized protein N7511_008467 [Penicillium nucicola]|uniref:uncharacterized protein n=1 Tax=Penicillium nucicola TaxID=1850975 RepID=UPI0025452701|nr:uncharacterized protein N7511_008467 [Penicillium nucicola]KAJ5751502.1 hypothetical protein N7511_008467 [Penicillium nucicola]
MSQSEHYLVRMATCSTSLAQVWAALATFKGNPERRGVYALNQRSENPPADSAEMRPAKRPRRYTCQGDFVDSGGIQVGSSSPPHDDSYDGSQSSSLGYFDLKDHCLGVTPEDDTLRLASCVIRHILYFAPPQENPLNTAVVDFRDAKTRLSASTVLTEQVVIATDDGGLCLRREKPGGGFSLVNNHVAILEAKARFQTLENDGLRSVSD